MNQGARWLLRAVAIICSGAAAWYLRSALRDIVPYFTWNILAIAVFLGLLSINFSIWTVEEKD